MTKITFEISVSLDGFVAGPNLTLEQPLGEGGEGLHDWVVKLESWRESHGMSGGETGTDSELLEESIAAAGAAVLGRRMFSGGEGPWESDPNPDGWWGEEPPFGTPVFVVTHHEREPLEKIGTTFEFVTGGVEEAVSRARAVAGDRNVAIGGGASVIQQALGAGLIDEFQLHIAPLFLGGGVRLFEGEAPAVERTRLVDSPSGVVHAAYRVLK